MNNELVRMWTEAFWFKLIHYPGIYLKGVKKHTK
jgi:hypothetical protein